MIIDKKPVAGSSYTPLVLPYNWERDLWIKLYQTWTDWDNKKTQGDRRKQDQKRETPETHGLQNRRCENNKSVNQGNRHDEVNRGIIGRGPAPRCVWRLSLPSWLAPCLTILTMKESEYTKNSPYPHTPRLRDPLAPRLGKNVHAAFVSKAKSTTRIPVPVVGSSAPLKRIRPEDHFNT